MLLAIKLYIYIKKSLIYIYHQIKIAFKQFNGYELALLFILALAIILLINDVYNPLYSFIGDEYAFYSLATELSQDKIFSIDNFLRPGVYGDHSIFDSIFNAIIIKIFGATLLGWKMSNIITLSLSTVLIYNIGNIIFKKKIFGLTASIFFCFSHYIYAFAHIGYNNLNALIPQLFSMYFIFKYRSNHNKILLSLAGISMGAALFTFQPAKLIIILLFPLILAEKRKAGYFFLTFIPITLVYLRYYFFNDYQSIITNGITDNQLSGYNFYGIYLFFTSLFSSKYVPIHHYVIGPLFNIILSSSFISGLFFIFKSKKKRLIYYYLILACFFTALIIITTFYSRELPTTRLHTIAPWIAIIGSYGLIKLIKNKRILYMILALYIISELYIFYVAMPVYHPSTKESLMLSLLIENPTSNVCIVHNTPPTMMNDLIEYYYIEEPLFINVEQISDTRSTNNCNILIPYNIDLTSILFDLDTYVSKSYTKNYYWDGAHISNIIYYK